MVSFAHKTVEDWYAPLALFAKRWTPRLPPWVNALLVVVLAYTFAQLTWALLSPTSQTPVVAPAPPQAAEPETARRDLLREVAALQLFGSAAPELQQAAPVPIEAPDTRLRLTLRGVIASQDPARAMVIIADERGEELHYRQGAELPGGAVLEQIHPDRVILLRNERYETLRLPTESAPDDGGVAPVASRPTPRPSVAPRRQVRQPAPADQAVPAPEPAVADDQASLADFRQELTSNPERLWDLVQVQPVMEDGRIKGYTLTPQREEHLFRRAGLRPGDVITQVNGIALDDPSGLQSVFAQLTTADEITLEVERQGRPSSIVLRLSE